MTTIRDVKAREILDSRGNPTLEVDILLEDGILGRASVPSGASTGSRESLELRDNDPARYGGMGVERSIDNILNKIAPAIKGLCANNQSHIDNLMIQLDATHDRSRLGANTILAVSLATAHASAKALNLPLFRCLHRSPSNILPTPMFNVLNGGKHAVNSTDVQEFMVVPAGLSSFRDAVRAGSEIFHSLKRLMSEKGLSTTVGDEGGFALSKSSNELAIELILQSIENAGYSPGQQCYIAMDIAASELTVNHGKTYRISSEQKDITSHSIIDMYKSWVSNYPIISIEDGLDEDDWEGWMELTSILGDRIQLIGDDIYATRLELLNNGIRKNASNAILVKPNQIGTITETLEVIETATSAKWGTIVSHRSGETEDTTIADIAVSTAARQIKAGAPSRGERTAKYNRLLRIEESLGSEAIFAGNTPYAQFLEKQHYD